MTYATIMAHVELGRGSEKRSKLAVDLASRYDAVLFGVAAAVPGEMPVVQGRVSELLTQDQESVRLLERLADTKSRFYSAARELEHIQWRESLDYPTEALLREALAADLIILGRDQLPTNAGPPLDVDHIILHAGRPVLLVPPEIDNFSGRRILIGWTDTRESRRAVWDAIPLLQKADEVTLLEMCEKGTERSTLERLAELESYLGRHGVGPCTKFYINKPSETAEGLIQIANEERADLIVAGAYGHSRLGERIFGGVTRELLSTSPLCCFLSH